METKQNLCKLCFSSKTHNLTIFGSIEKELKVETILLKHLGLHINLSKEDVVCSDCWEIVNNFHQLYLRVEQYHQMELINVKEEQFDNSNALFQETQAANADQQFEVTFLKDESTSDKWIDNESQPELNPSTSDRSFKKSVMENSDIKEKIRSGLFKVERKRGANRSRAWEVFGQIIDENNEIVKEYVACRMCFAVNKTSNKSTTNLVNHKCVKNLSQEISEISQVNKENVQKSITRWCIEDTIPVTKLTGMGFISMLQTICSISQAYQKPIDVRHMLPHPRTVHVEVEKLRKNYDKTITEKLKEAECYCLTSTLWTDPYYHNYNLSVTVHYITDGIFYQRLLAVQDFRPSHEHSGGESILAEIRKALERYAITDLEKSSFVTAPGKNIMNALRHYQRLDCNTYLINSMVQSSVGAIAEIDELLENCRKLVQYFRKSSSLKTSLKSEVSSRWNSAYLMITSILQNWTDINIVLKNRLETNHQILDGINHQLLKSLASFLEKFKIATDKLETSSAPTLHLVYPQFLHLFESCVPLDEDSDIIKRLKDKMKQEIEREWKPRIKTIHKVALFLYPPCKPLLTFSEAEKKDVWNFIAANSLEDDGSGGGDSTSSVAKEESSSSFNHSLDHQDVFSRFYAVESSIEKTPIREEITKYIAEPIDLQCNFNTLKWWNLNKYKFKNLYKIYRKILCIPAAATSTWTTEGATANLTFSNRISDEKFDSLLVLKSNYKVDNIDFKSIEK